MRSCCAFTPGPEEPAAGGRLEGRPQARWAAPTTRSALGRRRRRWNGRTPQQTRKNSRDCDHWLDWALAWIELDRGTVATSGRRLASRRRTVVQILSALLQRLCLCDDSFLGRAVVGFIHGQTLCCSRAVPDLWSSRPDVSSRDDPLPCACVGLFLRSACSDKDACSLLASFCGPE